jgi:hypothetical protein
MNGIQRGGQVPKARARSSRKLEGEDRSAEFWFYGEGEAINHVRIVFEVKNTNQAQEVVDRNIAFWRDAIAVTSVIATSHYTAAQTLGTNSTLHPVFLGEGDVSTPLFGFQPVLAKPVPANYEAAAHVMANWRPEFKHHLHFLAKFLDPTCQQMYAGCTAIVFWSGTSSAVEPNSPPIKIFVLSSNNTAAPLMFKGRTDERE